MKKIFTLYAFLIFANIVTGQTLETGKTIEFNLPAEDCSAGTFYLGRFLVGKYEISANVAGIHANNRGWKIIVGSNWGGDITFKNIYSNLPGIFIYQKHDNASFDLWWDAKLGSGGQQWTPHIKVEYQIGNCAYNNVEPSRSNTITLAENSTVSMNSLTVNGNVGIGTNAPSAKLHVNNGDNSYGAILGQADEQNFQLYTKTLTTSPVNIESFRIGLKYGTDENNGYISFYRGGGTSGGYLGFSTNGSERFRINTNGNIAIGKPTAEYKLDVCGTIRAKEVKVEEFTCSNGSFNGTLAANNITLTTNGQTADFVFESDYNLLDLSEVETFIKENKHLPEIPSAAQMEEQGVNLAEMNKLLLQKVEELTLYAIEKDKEVKKIKELRTMEIKDLEQLKLRLINVEQLLTK